MHKSIIKVNGLKISINWGGVATMHFNSTKATVKFAFLYMAVIRIIDIVALLKERSCLRRCDYALDKEGICVAP